MRRFIVAMSAALTLAATAVLAGSVGAATGPWQAVKAATARYHAFEQAVKAGYSIAGEPCVASPDGAMGIHAVNLSLVVDPAIEPLQPEVLLYIPDDSATLKLVGVEYFQVALANTEAGPAPWFDANPPPNGFLTSPPSVLGQTFDGPMPGHNPSMPWHYDLHVWLWADNPSALFAPFNPALTCPAG